MVSEEIVEQNSSSIEIKSDTEEKNVPNALNGQELLKKLEDTAEKVQEAITSACAKIKN